MFLLMRRSPESLRDVRGFSVKFKTQQGNWDFVGNDIPVRILSSYHDSLLTHPCQRGLDMSGMLRHFASCAGLLYQGWHSVCGPCALAAVRPGRQLRACFESEKKTPTFQLPPFGPAAECELVRRPNPKTNIQEGWRILDFLAHHPESCHIVSSWIVLHPVSIRTVCRMHHIDTNAYLALAL